MDRRSPVSPVLNQGVRLPEHHPDKSIGVNRCSSLLLHTMFMRKGSSSLSGDKTTKYTLLDSTHNREFAPFLFNPLRE